MSEGYKAAGVDIEKGDELVERIKKKVQSTYGDRVYAGVGGFACLYKAGDRFLAAGTDGVGTKLKLAQKLNTHNTIGIDLVAMCINDILCTGARPLFFMDYLACGSLDLEISEAIIDGVVKGCQLSEAALIGGETAEMPGFYGVGEYDLAGFAVGEVFENELLDGSKIKSGDTLIGLKSSGFHSNGYSLVRKLIKDDEIELMKDCLRPTEIYWSAVKTILPLVSGLSHITGGGFSNIARMNKNFNYHIDDLTFLETKPSFMTEICQRSGLSTKELFEVFNMGIGMIICTDKPDQVMEKLNGAHGAIVLGHVENGNGQVIFSN